MTDELRHTPGPWHTCGEGKCSCMTVMCNDYPVAKVTCGKWGDDYASIKLEGPSLDLKAVAVMEQITYGELNKETAEANCRLIAAAPDMLEALADAAFVLGTIGIALDPSGTARDLMLQCKLRVAAAIEKATKQN